MQLVQTEKLASLGRMSAGIIHEINNPLNFATTGLFTLRKKSQFLAPEQQADYTEILTDVEEGSSGCKPSSRICGCSRIPKPRAGTRWRWRRWWLRRCGS